MDKASRFEADFAKLSRRADPRCMTVVRLTTMMVVQVAHCLRAKRGDADEHQHH